MWWIFVVGVVLGLYLLFISCQRPPNFPPGPRPWPLVGNVIAIMLKLLKFKCHHLVWEEWRKEYGQVLGLRLGAEDVVVVFGKDLIMEVANRGELSGRPSGFFYTLRSFGKKAGIVFSDGYSWALKRKVALKYMRIFGFGSRTMEYLILAETQALVELRMLDSGEPVLVNEMFDVAIVNILWALVAGQRFELSDERLKKLCQLMKRSFKVADMSGGILNCFPCLRHVMPDVIGYTELKNVLDSLHDFIADTIKQHKATVNVYQPRDVIDAYLIDMIHHKNEACSDEELQVICLDLLQAGAETVANTLVFAVLYMVRHPQAQAKVQEEVDRVLGAEGAPEFDHRIRMPYVEAVLMETLRLSSVAPVGIAHTATSHTKLDKYDIPKGTMILLSIYSMHMDVYWTDSATFRPERFLDDKGLVVQNDWLMPFGSGKRRCIGESLARSELFLFFTNLMRNFTVSNPLGAPPPNTEPVNGVTLSAKPFKAIFKRRF